MESARLFNPNLPNLQTNTKMRFTASGFIAKGFNEAVKRAIHFYQKRLGKMAPTAPNFAAGMVFLTGKPSTSDWTWQEISRLNDETPELPKSLATLGAALLFISRACFVFFPPDENSDDSMKELVVSYPFLSANVAISFVPSDTHINIGPEISVKEAGKLFLRGSGAFLTHLGWCLLANTSFGKDSRVGPNERIIGIKKRGLGKPSIALVEVQDKPPYKGGWGEKSTPGETHVEERIEFKGHFHYKPDQVTVNREGW